VVVEVIAPNITKKDDFWAFLKSTYGLVIVPVVPATGATSGTMLSYPKKGLAILLISYISVRH
jgi:hypothetical protein